jgi:hypothetical protein
MSTKTKTTKTSPADYAPRVKGITFGPTAATVSEGINKDRLLATIGAVQRTHEKTAWWLGDLLAYALPDEDAGYEGVASYAEVLPHTTYKSIGSLRNIASVSRRVPPEMRVEGLHWRTHRVVASLEPDEQRTWLAEALAEDWTSDELQRRIRRGDEDGDASEDGDEALACVCDKCGQKLPTPKGGRS